MDFGFLFDNFAELTITGLALGAIYALIALGYTMVYGVLQLINFAHSEVFMYGTFAVAWVFVLLPRHGVDAPEPRRHAGPHGLALVAAMLMSAAIALLLERVAYRPLIKRGAPKLIPLISAIGASFALAEIMGLRDRFALVRPAGQPQRLRRARPATSTPARSRSTRTACSRSAATRSPTSTCWSSSPPLVMMFALDQFVRRTKFGRGIRAVAQDPESAALMGVNSTRVVQMTFLLGGMMAGAAATLYMIRIGSTRQNAGFIFGVKAFTAAVMGGIGNLRGALLGGLLLGVVENWGSAVFGTEWKDVVAFVLLVLILLVRPSGLLGEALGKARA